MGTARINRAIIGALGQSTRGEVRVIASRRAETAAAYAKEWDIPNAVSSYEALLERDDIDAVYIGLPNSMHVEWTVRALDAGKHVLCEKPLALTPAGVDEIARAAERNRRVAAEGFMYRHHPLTRAVLDIVRSGRLGQIRLIKGAFTFMLVGRSPDIRTDPLLGGGSLWDVGCYPASYSCLIEDAQPREVMGWQVADRNGIDLTFAAMMRFGSGAIAQFDSGFQSPYRSEMEIVGADAELRVEVPFKVGPDSRLRLVRGDEESLVPFAADPPYLGEVEDFHAAVLDGVPHPLSLSESRRTAGVLTALYASASSNRPVLI
jgi:D-xylose 1-dehydrogenase (NADP+, D-xylono-1,5-lactone-forming)